MAEDSLVQLSTPTRRRKFAARTKTGCVTCRTRRVKCDETKPACQRCLRAQRSCGGYPLAPAPVLALLDHRLHATAVVPTTAELELSRFFINRIGVYGTDEFNATFWCREVPQVGRSMPALWHVGNALAGVTWLRSAEGARLPPAASAQMEQESARQYSASIRHIIKMTTAKGHPSPCDQAIVLLASILLSSYAISVGETAMYASILATSRRLMRQWAFWEHLALPSIFSLATQIMYVYIKMEWVAREFHLASAGFDAKLPAAESSPMRWCDALRYLQMRPIKTAVRAGLELDMIWNGVQDILQALPFQPAAADVATAYTQRHTFAKLFRSWESRYANLTGCKPAAAKGVDTAALHLRRVLVDVLFRVRLDSHQPFRDETCWDPFVADFAAALASVEPVLRRDGPNSETILLGMPSVYTSSCNFIAQKCRDPAVRRRAAAILHGALPAAPPAQASDKEEESRWIQLPLVVRQVIRLEESAWELGGEGCGDDACVPGSFICNMHRVARMYIDHAVEGPPEIVFWTVGDILHDRHGYREVIDVSVSLCRGEIIPVHSEC